MEFFVDKYQTIPSIYYTKWMAALYEIRGGHSKLPEDFGPLIEVPPSVTRLSIAETLLSN